MRPRNYEKLRYQTRAHEMQEKKDKDSFLQNPIAEQLSLRDKTLVLRLETLLAKYKDNNDTREKILQEFNMYCVNVTIAQELNDKKAIAKRTSEFHKWLNQF